RRHTRFSRDWSSDVCSSDLGPRWNGAGVRVIAVVEDTDPPRLVYDPGHPDADEDGYVAMPNVNVVTEMVDMIGASRAYEANIARSEERRVGKEGRRRRWRGQ